MSFSDEKIVSDIMENQEKLSITSNQYTQFSSAILKESLDQKYFSDVTLVTEDEQQFLAHKVILSGFSSFFKRILHNNPHPHPLIYLNGFIQSDLEALLNFMYAGESEVAYNNLDRFLKLATQLEIVGVPSIRSEKDGTNSSGPVENASIIENQNDDDTNKEINHGIKGVNETIINENANKTVKDDIVDNIAEGVAVFSLSRKQEIMEDIAEMKTPENLAMEDKFPTADSILDTLAMKDMISYDGIEAKTPLIRKGREVKFFCDKCGYKTNYAGNLKKHMDGVHLGSIFSCNFCGKTYTLNSSLRFHIRTAHFGIRQICQYCGFKFKQSGHLRRHVAKQHEDVKKTEAEEMDILETNSLFLHTSDDRIAKVIRIKSNEVVEDKVINEERNGGQMFPCNFCGDLFKKAFYLKRHLEKVHNTEYSQNF